MYKTLLLILLAVTVAAPGLAAAQQPSAPTEAKEEGLKLGIFDVSGYLDASYNKLSRGALFTTSGTQSRVFDIERSGFALRRSPLDSRLTRSVSYSRRLNRPPCAFLKSRRELFLCSVVWGGRTAKESGGSGRKDRPHPGPLPRGEGDA